MAVGNDERGSRGIRKAGPVSLRVPPVEIIAGPDQGASIATYGNHRTGTGCDSERRDGSSRIPVAAVEHREHRFLTVECKEDEHTHEHEHADTEKYVFHRYTNHMRDSHDRHSLSEYYVAKKEACRSPRPADTPIIGYRTIEVKRQLLIYLGSIFRVTTACAVPEREEFNPWRTDPHGGSALPSV